MILKVAALGRPILRQRARPLSPEEIAAPAIQALVDDMIETMHDYHGVGLAASQVHHDLRIAVLEVSANPRYPEAPRIPLKVLVNPEYSPIGDERHSDWEGCLSVPGLRGLVPRYQRIEVRALDRHGVASTFVAEGFLARVIQHEVDHLDGFVYLDRMPDLQTLGYAEEIRARHGPGAAGT